MIPLIVVTLIWAFSFSLIGRYLGNVDSFLVAAIRMGLASLCLLPCLIFGNQAKAPLQFAIGSAFIFTALFLGKEKHNNG